MKRTHRISALVAAPASAKLARDRDPLTGKSVPPFVNGPVKFVTKDNFDTNVPWDTGVAKIKSGKVSLDVDFSSAGG
jgi:hypothetical protein